MKKISLLALVIFSVSVLAIPHIFASHDAKRYDLHYVNLCWSGYKWHYCDEPAQKSFVASHQEDTGRVVSYYFISPQRKEGLHIKDMSPHWRRPLKSRLYHSNPYWR